jgi:GMP synthase (glutamine-hydrolysing)
MKPVAILQHEASQGPGILLDHLQQQGLAYQLLSPCGSDSAPVNARDYSGIVVLGSNHCANEALPWIEDERCLLKSALVCDVPVLGHCFGAQMLARAMGARVWRNPCPNIGWSEVWVTPEAQRRMQLPPTATIFNWHYDTFELPPGATRTMVGRHCLNKGFVRGRHWAFQGHLEVTAHSVRDWCAQGHDELLQAGGPAVQTEAHILAQLQTQLAPLHALAHRSYGAWTAQLDRGAWSGCRAGVEDEDAVADAVAVAGVLDREAATVVNAAVAVAANASAAGMASMVSGTTVAPVARSGARAAHGARADEAMAFQAAQALPTHAIGVRAVSPG